MDQNLKFIITADGSGLKGAEKAIDFLQEKINLLRVAIANSTKDSLYFQQQIDRLNKEFKDGLISVEQYRKGILNYENAIKRADNDTKEYEKQLSKLNIQQRRLGATTSSLTKSTNQNIKSTTGASSAVVAFTGIIQDAPYGIRGVANNIEFFSQQMVYLTRTTGGAKNALKAFGASLAGPTGIFLGISIVTSLLTVFSDRLSTTGKNAKTAADLMDEFKDSLRGVAQSNLEGAKGALEETFALQQLKKQAEDLKQPMEDRIKAVNQLQEKYPAYLGNMTDEEILGGQVADVYKRITTNILEMAKAKAAQDLIVDNMKEQLTLGAAVDKMQTRITEEQQKQNKLEEEAIQMISQNVRGAETARQRAASQEQKVNQLIEDRNKLIRRQGELAFDNLKLDEEFQNILERAGIDFTDLFGDGKKLKPEDIIERPKNIKPIEIPVTITDLSSLDIEAVAKRAKSGGLKLVESFRLIESGAVSMSQSISASMEGLNKVATPETIAFGQRMIELQNTAKIVTDTISAGFNAMTRQIVDSLNTGSAVLDAIISAFIGSISSLVSALISQQITESILGKAKIETERGKSSANAVTIATNAAAALGPLGAVALPGLIASQLALIQGAFAGIQVGSFAQGGIVPGGSFTGDRVPAYVNSGEMILNNRQQQNLFGMLNGGVNASRVNNGEGSYIASTTVRGSDLLVVLERAQKKNRRFGSGINTNQ